MELVQRKRIKAGQDEKESTRGILVVSFGTSYPETRKKTIDGIEHQFEQAFPENKVYRAFTSNRIIRKIKQEEGIVIMTVREAMERMQKDRITEVIVQPTYIMGGDENNRMISIIREVAGCFENVYIGKPLLTDIEDYRKIAHVLASKEQTDATTAMVLMGHGSTGCCDERYLMLEDTFRQLGYHHIYVGALKGNPSIQKILANMKEENYSKIVLRPFMIVAGNHAKKDMLSEREASWKSFVQKQGYEVIGVMEGMGEMKEIQQMFVEHAIAAINSNFTIEFCSVK